MGWFSYFKQEKAGSAKVAKERLQIVIAHERLDRNGPEYLPQLRRDIMEVIRKYVAITDDQVNVQYEKGSDFDVLELNIALPDREH
ncbi:MAG: cell division topological specificity factor MinE [Pseudomonadota bacterium]|jgi:cell division topological specificity factor|uniref:Cell division topological specificity factor n=2 Tax=Thiothrix TaxID=1030 RepID=A0A8B0SJZ2_9GAMM|nr:cell division topological specificity factor MinE [Thiothrix fructosivorans]MBO0611529.1 cell division topological specificity factor MinE [Thiothrix fructosivorans]OQX01080.1 MAG: cell division topological specificity factor MinE [Thiothrix lacustris]QTX10800.1 cell division topological specificity factor MinE [Thiothrix fructosivorans]